MFVHPNLYLGLKESKTMSFASGNTFSRVFLFFTQLFQFPQLGKRRVGKSVPCVQIPEIYVSVAYDLKSNFSIARVNTNRNRVCKHLTTLVVIVHFCYCLWYFCRLLWSAVFPGCVPAIWSISQSTVFLPVPKNVWKLQYNCVLFG